MLPSPILILTHPSGSFEILAFGIQARDASVMSKPSLEVIAILQSLQLLFRECHFVLGLVPGDR
tara:strand:- start:254 stop:445 length:192 start_codon:yes stop_codon:yes gene_type:complete